MFHPKLNLNAKHTEFLAALEKNRIFRRMFENLLGGLRYWHVTNSRAYICGGNMYPYILHFVAGCVYIVLQEYIQIFSIMNIISDR